MRITERALGLTFSRQHYGSSRAVGSVSRNAFKHTHTHARTRTHTHTHARAHTHTHARAHTRTHSLSLCAAPSKSIKRSRLAMSQFIRFAPETVPKVEVYIERERKRGGGGGGGGREYNRGPSMSWFGNFYSKFSPILGFFEGLPGRLD